MKRCPCCAAENSRHAARVNGYNLLRCPVCGLIFIGEDPRAVDYDALYTASGGYDSHVKEAAELKAGRLVPLPKARRLALAAIKQQKFQAGGVLEVGCGVGNFLAHLERANVPCSGVDLSSNAVELARQHLKAKVVCGELDYLNFPTFDAICMWEVIEHLTNLDQMMTLVAGRLAPGGRLYLSTPNYESSWMWRDLPNDPRQVPPVHVTFWNRKSLTRYLRALGLISVEVTPVSVPISAALRSRFPLAKYLVYADAVLRRKQRCTLYATATLPSTPTRR